MVRFTKKMQEVICQRVKRIRIEQFGEGHGAQKLMAKAFDIPYTTYRGYESNRLSLDFLHQLSKKFSVPLLWLLNAEGESKGKEVGPLITILPDVDKIRAPQFTVLKVKDERMEPTIRKGAWVGIRTEPFLEKFSGKIVGIRRDDHILVRRIVVKNKSILAITDKPALTKDTMLIHKKDVLGEVAWCWQKF